MTSPLNPTRRLALGFVGSCLTSLLLAQSKNPDPWKESDLLQASELAATLAAASGEGKPRPLILHVGFPVLYRGAHIPGSVYAGPAAKPEGKELLMKAVSGVPYDREIVIYCGCCPWQNCPNVRPAFVALHDAGYRRIKVLVIPTDLHKDWVEKGYPVEKG